MNIGILGGTFNPVHLGHLYMAEEAKKALKLDHVIFMPNYIPPHKENTDVSVTDRVEMLHLALSDDPSFSVSTFEIEKEGISYTFETVEELHRRHPLDTFFFIIGEDSYVNFWRWKNPERILQASEIVVLERSGYRKEDSMKTDTLFQHHHKKAWRVMADTIEISSTDIRRRLKEGLDIKGLVPEKVRTYIKENCLYENTPWTYLQLEHYVKEHVKPSRFTHIQGVVEASKMLSELYDGNEEDVSLAALCHDMLKDQKTSDLLHVIRQFGEDPVEKGLAPQILHAQAGALFLQHECGVRNMDILNAVRYHTTGRPQMSKTEKIVFIADYIEKNRNFPGVDELRKIALLELDEAVYTALSQTLTHLKSLQMPIASDSVSAFEYYGKKRKERTKHE